MKDVGEKNKNNDTSQDTNQNVDKIKKSVKFSVVEPSTTKRNNNNREKISSLLIKRQSVAALRGKGIVSSKLMFNTDQSDEVEKSVTFEEASETRRKRYSSNRERVSSLLIKRQSIAALQGSNRVNKLIDSHSTPGIKREISKRPSLANLAVGLKERKDQLADMKMAGIKETNDEEEIDKRVKAMKRPSLIKKHPSLTLTEDNSVNKLIDSHGSNPVQGIKREISKHPSLAFLGEIDPIKNKLSSAKKLNVGVEREVGRLGNKIISAIDEEEFEEENELSRKIGSIGEGSVDKLIGSHETGGPVQGIKREISRHPSLAQLGEIDPIKNKLSTRDDKDVNEEREVGKLRLSAVTDENEDVEGRKVGKLKLSAKEEDYREKEGRKVGKIGNKFSTIDDDEETEEGRKVGKIGNRFPGIETEDNKRGRNVGKIGEDRFSVNETGENKGRRRNRFSRSLPKSNVTFVDSKLEEKLLNSQSDDAEENRRNRFSRSPPKSNVTFVDSKLEEKLKNSQTRRTSLGGGRTLSPPPEHHIHFEKPLERDSHKPRPKSPPPTVNVKFDTDPDLDKESSTTSRPRSPPPENHIHFHKIDVQHERQQNPPPSPPPLPIKDSNNESIERDQSSPGESFRTMITTKFAGGGSNNQMPSDVEKFYDEGDALPSQFSLGDFESSSVRDFQYEEHSMFDATKEQNSSSGSSSENESLVKAKASIDAIFPSERDDESTYRRTFTNFSGVRSTTELSRYESFRDEGDDAFQTASNKKKQFSWGNIKSINQDEEHSMLETTKENLVAKTKAEKKSQRNLCWLAIAGSVMILIGIILVIFIIFPHQSDTYSPTLIPTTVKMAPSKKLLPPTALYTSSSPQSSKGCSHFTSISDDGTMLSSFDNLGSQTIFLPFSIFWNGDAEKYTRIIVNKRGTILFGDNMPTHDSKDVSGINIAWTYNTENNKYTGKKYYGNVYTSLDKNGSVFIISWEDVTLKDQAIVSFQIALHLNGKIEMRWGDGSLPESHRVISFLVDSREQRKEQAPLISEDLEKNKKVLGMSAGVWPANTCRTFLPNKNFYSTFDP